MISLQALSSSLHAGTAKRGYLGGGWAEERLLGDLRQSVPQNGHVRLRILEILSKACKAPIHDKGLSDAESLVMLEFQARFLHTPLGEPLTRTT